MVVRGQTKQKTYENQLTYCRYRVLEAAIASTGYRAGYVGETTAQIYKLMWRSTSGRNKTMEQLLSKYAEFMKANGLMCHNLVIFNCVQEIVSKPVPPALCCSHLMIDEYQDCSAAQHQFIVEIATNMEATLTVVGDADQYIYGFSSGEANSGAMADISNAISPCVMIYMPQNYRSSPKIIEFAEWVMDYDGNRLAKPKMKSTFENGGIVEPVQLVTFGNKSAQLLVIAKYIEDNVPVEEYAEVAVLYRSNNNRAEIVKAFAGRTFSYVNKEPVVTLQSRRNISWVLDDCRRTLLDANGQVERTVRMIKRKNNFKSALCVFVMD